MNRIFAGLLGGCVATAPMTLLMELWHRQLPAREQYPLPPREITNRLADEAGVEPMLDEGQLDALTLASHFAYGAGAGAIYASISPKLPGAPVLKGAAFGLLLWIVSYLGWLPMTGMLRSASQHPPRRNALMIVAHLLWGGGVGVLVERLSSSEP